MTPPEGMNLFIASYRFKKPITELCSASLPFMVILLVALMLITYWPWLSLRFLQIDLGRGRALTPNPPQVR